MNRSINFNTGLPNNAGFFSKFQSAGSKMSSTTWIVIGVIL